jgi:hypothetical protein
MHGHQNIKFYYEFCQNALIVLCGYIYNKNPQLPSALGTRCQLSVDVEVSSVTTCNLKDPISIPNSEIYFVNPITSRIVPDNKNIHPIDTTTLSLRVKRPKPKADISLPTDDVK